MLAGGGVWQSATSDVQNAGGTVHITAMDGGFVQEQGATLSTHAASGGGAITIRAATDVLASSINASTALLDVGSLQGNIMEALGADGLGDAGIDLKGGSLTLKAKGAIGALGRHGEAIENSSFSNEKTTL